MGFSLYLTVCPDGEAGLPRRALPPALHQEGQQSPCTQSPPPQRARSANGPLFLWSSLPLQDPSSPGGRRTCPSGRGLGWAVAAPKLALSHQEGLAAALASLGFSARNGQPLAKAWADRVLPPAFQMWVVAGGD